MQLILTGIPPEDQPEVTRVVKYSGQTPTFANGHVNGAVQAELRIGKGEQIKGLPQIVETIGWQIFRSCPDKDVKLIVPDHPNLHWEHEALPPPSRKDETPDGW